MSTDTAQRPSRADQVRTERRRKAGSTVNSGLKLHVDASLKDPAYEYRWVNDVPGRIQSFVGQDWDRVESAAIAGDGNSNGTIPTKFVGNKTDAVLMRKRKEWFDADAKEKRKPLDQQDEAIRRGTIHQAQGSNELAGGIAYTPNGSNTISRD